MFQSTVPKHMKEKEASFLVSKSRIKVFQVFGYKNQRLKFFEMFGCRNRGLKLLKSSEAETRS